MLKVVPGALNPKWTYVWPMTPRELVLQSYLRRNRLEPTLTEIRAWFDFMRMELGLQCVTAFGNVLVYGDEYRLTALDWIKNLRRFRYA